MERLFITKVENALRSLRLNTKTPQTCEFHKWNNKLRELNDGLADDYEQDFEKHIKNYNRKNNTSYTLYF